MHAFVHLHQSCVSRRKKDMAWVDLLHNNLDALQGQSMLGILIDWTDAAKGMIHTAYIAIYAIDGH
jgi:hypothetical protein